MRRCHPVYMAHWGLKKAKCTGGSQRGSRFMSLTKWLAIKSCCIVAWFNPATVCCSLKKPVCSGETALGRAGAKVWQCKSRVRSSRESFFCGTKSFCRTKPQRSQLATRMAPSSWSCFVTSAVWWVCNGWSSKNLRHWSLKSICFSTVRICPSIRSFFVFRFRYRQY